ncbi:hypothetical protein IVB30_02795 [Bradyrhizobium sp. 200]|uniref:hypothetical protein n=1 Tax=Bradyrhizobium sp. 200 TaxID=2782665 RepID=UPI001FFE93A5|nr:hypothetical protein [Bradyrhizobium sp. 200]UPJ50378.1 hypothetical protein IVB30_02795 [Bradyrhizobium sp. 200]
MDTKILHILVVAVVVLAVGEAYLIHENSKLLSVLDHGNRAMSTIQRDGASLPDGVLSQGPIDPAPENTLKPFSGVVRSVDSSGWLIGSETKPVHVHVSSDTKIVRMGELKTPQQAEADMQKFHEYSQELMRDPKKNKAELSHLISPSGSQETSISISDVRVGDTVMVLGDPDGSGGVNAVRIAIPVR